jgi:hypothetical protein
MNMVRVIKSATGGLAPTMRSGAHERIPAVWGVEVNGRLVARIFTVNGDSVVVEAQSGRQLYTTMMAPRKRRQSRVAVAKDWAVNYFNEVAA